MFPLGRQDERRDAVSLKTEAYERLKTARRYPGESFSEVILRASWPEDTITGEELLRRCRDRGAWFTEAELSAIEASKAADRPAEDKAAGSSMADRERWEGFLASFRHSSSSRFPSARGWMSA
jgi:hypothetical protein